MYVTAGSHQSTDAVVMEKLLCQPILETTPTTMVGHARSILRIFVTCSRSRGAH
jgi:hypothetical protein